MIRTLQRHGNSQALVIDKPLMEALGIEQETPLQITISGNSLIITPAHVGLGEKKIRDTIEKLRPEYQEMLKNLAK